VGVHESRAKLLALRLRKCSVVCPLDKSKADCAAVCPWSWQKTCWENVAKAGLSFDYNSLELEKCFEELATKLSYSGAVSTATKIHWYGQRSWWPKLSGFDIDEKENVCRWVREKLRPTCSYARHRFRTLFSVVTRGLLWMMSLL